MLTWMMMSAAMAGDVWLVLDQIDDDGTILHLEMPVDGLEGDSEVTMNGHEVKLGDLVAKVEAKPGAVENFKSTEGDSVLTGSLEHRLPKPGAKKNARELALTVGDANTISNGFSLAVNLTDGSAAGSLLTDQLKGSLSLKGSDSPTMNPGLLTNYPPMVLFQVVSPDGGALRLATR